MNLGTRIGIGIVGALLLFFGWAARSLELETSRLGFMVLTAPDGTTGVYQPPDLGLDGPLEVQEVGEGAVAVMYGDQVFFTGTEDEAAFWIETKGAEPAFVGNPTAARAWVAEQEAAEDDFFWPITLMVSGGAALLAAVALGRT